MPSAQHWIGSDQPAGPEVEDGSPEEGSGPRATAGEELGTVQVDTHGGITAPVGQELGLRKGFSFGASKNSSTFFLLMGEERTK